MDPDDSVAKINCISKQLEIARAEIKNLRSQLISLKFSFKKDVKTIQDQINNGIEPRSTIETCEQPVQNHCDCELAGWRSIGIINTWFPGKRGVPRQASLSPEAHGVITLSPVVINNPAYSLSGLEDFSHCWIIFHFHQTCGSHVKTKVAPPRLAGARVGVFGTRSPHRPCPIGLSLVKLICIEGNVVHFSGVDMVDGTPVLDIKPYIPQYDDPRCLPSRNERGSPETNESAAARSSQATPVKGGAVNEGPSQDQPIERLVEGESGSESPVMTLRLLNIQSEADSDCIATTPTNDTLQQAAGSCDDSARLREAPDGEEGPVQIASWINSPPARQLQVSFLERALTQLSEMDDHTALRQTITRLLEQDPRSNYLRRKLGSQSYTFRIGSNYVGVEFDDAAGTVTVTSLEQAL